MKLQTKINLYSAVMFIALLLIINAAIYFTFSRMMFESELERVTGEAKQTVKGMNQADANIPMDDLLRAHMPVNGMLQIVKSDGTRRSAVTPTGQSKLRDIPVTFGNRELRKIIEYDDTPYAFVSIPTIGGDGEVAELQLTQSLVSTADNLTILRFVLIAITIIASIPVLLSARLLSNFIVSPITSLIKTMKEIQESGHYKRIELPKQSKDELHQLGQTFNKMISQLEMNYEKQEQFVSNASHELKTPLTVIEAYADLLKRRGKEAPELFDESVGAIHLESQRMKELIEQLLLLARHDEQWQADMKEIQLNSFIEESIRSFGTAFGREISLNAEEHVKVKTDPQKLKQIFYILMDNAQKYSDAPISVNIRVEDKKALIEVVDKGIGIPKEELTKIFDRFYRVDESRSRKSGGFGLGLSLAKELAHIIDAEINIDSIEGSGTTAQIKIETSLTEFS
ncbi:MAG TPA: sensor histidine kinase [Bacillus bacterium]|uniref:histidine kinase n=1 Tax=Siminovitchia fordii TaxID=254759 RepID=A0ABQ4K7Y4_9BACI|nr:HAMP domain-containing sensor histidine kinase [Siminovitchia fordii]GIN21285.1 sensor histidine kinase YkoH [Siminovitchia fordii]HBZ10652.1 sensor histidine kinase [Bacillus sp. (in: firmicutes)]